jgi:hypothetical protein
MNQLLAIRRWSLAGTLSLQPLALSPIQIMIICMGLNVYGGQNRRACFQPLWLAQA